MAGAPAAIDGAAGLVGSLGMTSFVPQQIISDRDLMNTIDGNKAAQRFEHFLSDRNQMPAIAPPQYGGPQQGGQNGPGPSGYGATLKLYTLVSNHLRQVHVTRGVPSSTCRSRRFGRAA